jgi:TetR/AcrR family transcriptional regulator
MARLESGQMGHSNKNGEAHDPQARKAVLRSAAELFNRKGYAATTVREIVAAAGVSKPMLYYYFGNKEGIFIELVRSPFEKLKALLLSSEGEGGSASERLLALFDRLYTLICENIEAARLMYSTYYGPSQGAPFFDFEAYHIAVLKTLRRLTAEGIQYGEWCADNVEDASWAILGALSVAIEVQLSHPERAIGRDGLSRILKVIFRGMSVTPQKENM